MKIISKIILSLLLTINLTLNLYAQGYICAVGGGSEDYNNWSDAPYSWVVQKSDSGKIIILGVSSATEWLPTYFMSFGADTAYNKTISTIAAANLQETYDELITAKAIFLRGGDQWDYIRLWKGTKVDSAINFVFQNGGVIAGTSAGAAVLGDIDFSAQSGSAYPDEALQNPFYSRMKFENNFLNLIPNVLFDTHFIERARHGRLIAMIYNQHFTAGRDLIGAGIDDRTAICISPDGIGEVMGSGAVSIFYKDDLTKFAPINSGKYTIENMKSHLLTKGWKYDFINNAISFIPESAKDVDPDRVWFYPQTNFYLTGSNNLPSHLNNLNLFLTEINSSKILVITHPGFNGFITISDYLSSNNYNYDIVNITTSNLNDTEAAGKINQATCFIFAGDSLNVLSYLNQTNGLVNAAFYNQLAQQIPVFFFGNTGKISGHNFIGNTDTDLYAGYRGKMTINEGLFIFSELMFQPLLFDNSDYYENRMSSVIWGMMRNRKRIGVYLNGNDLVKVKSLENSICGNVQTPYLIVDARETTKVDSSTYRASGSIGPRQIVAMNNVRFSITNYPQINYLLEQGKFDHLTAIDDQSETNLELKSFQLYQNYPNPFNPYTTIGFSIPASPINRSPYQGERNRERLTSLIVYDILGRKIATLFNEEMDPGYYVVAFNGSNLSSGTYFYRLSTQDYSETKSMVLLK